MIQVRETNAGRSISAWVVLNAKGKEVATVQAHFGAVTRVDVWDNFTLDTLHGTVQQGKAGGYGYDKLTAAMSGLSIDGHKLTDHCSREGAPKPPKGETLYPVGFKCPKGYRLANYTSGDGTGEGMGYMDCYREAGLAYLKALGYCVLQAI